jgi:hypothetical protein
MVSPTSMTIIKIATKIGHLRLFLSNTGSLPPYKNRGSASKDLKHAFGIYRKLYYSIARVDRRLPLKRPQ